MGTHKSYTPKQKELIEYFCSRGIRDTLICKKTNIGYGVVQSITTKYWEQRMIKYKPPKQ